MHKCQNEERMGCFFGPRFYANSRMKCLRSKTISSSFGRRFCAAHTIVSPIETAWNEGGKRYNNKKYAIKCVVALMHVVPLLSCLLKTTPMLSSAIFDFDRIQTYLSSTKNLRRHRCTELSVRSLRFATSNRMPEKPVRNLTRTHHQSDYVNVHFVLLNLVACSSSRLFSLVQQNRSESMHCAQSI